MDATLLMNSSLLMLILGLIGSAIAVIRYMIGHLLNNDNEISKAKINMYDIVLAAFLYTVLVIVINLLDNNMEVLVIGIDPYASVQSTPLAHLTHDYNISIREVGVVWNDTGSDHYCLYRQLAGYKTPAHICTTLGYLELVSGYVEVYLNYLINWNMFLGLLGFLKIDVTVQPENILFDISHASVSLFQGLTISKFGGVDMEILGGQFERVVKFYALAKMQELFFIFMDRVGFIVLLTMGCAFRMFGYTRKLGGYLIAVMLSAYYVAPFGYIIMHRALYETDLYLHIVEDPYERGPGGTPIYHIEPKLGIEPPVLDMNIPSLSESLGHMFFPITGTYSSIKKVLQLLRVGGLYTLRVGSSRHPMVGDIGILATSARMTILLGICPVIVLFLFLSSVKAIAPLFGGESSIGGLTHFL